MIKRPKYLYGKIILDLLLYDKSSEEKRKKIVNKRLANLLQYTKENSEYFKNLYENTDINNISLDNLVTLPTTNKEKLEENFDTWVNDKALKKDEINAFLSNPDNYNTKYLDKYLIFQTSGTTGSPVTVINGDEELAVTLSIGLIRSYYEMSNVFGMMLEGRKKDCIATCILPTKTPCISTFLATEAAHNPINKTKDGSKIRIIDMEKSIEEIIRELNEAQPLCIAGFVTFIEMLCDEVDKGNLNIQPSYITTMGEKLTKEKQARIENTFKGTNIMNYACTECAEIAHRCRQGHFHINDDWIIVETVDNDNNPVPDGVLSDKILVTTLFNYVQPFIRYEVNDRCILHHEKCSCGNKSPWIEIEGRSFNPINLFDTENQIKKVSPISLELLIHKVDEGINRYQIEIKDNLFNIRLTTKDNYSKKEIFEKIKEVLEDYFLKNDIKKYTINLLDESPVIDKSGKFKQIYQIK